MADRVESGGSLEHGGEEAGRKREGRQPEDHGRVSRRRPLLKLLHTKHQVTSPRRQRLHRRIRLQTHACTAHPLQPLCECQIPLQRHGLDRARPNQAKSTDLSETRVSDKIWSGLPSRIWTHTHPFNGPFSGTNQVSQYQKGKTNPDFTEARGNEWQ